MNNKQLYENYLSGIYYEARAGNLSYRGTLLYSYARVIASKKLIGLTGNLVIFIEENYRQFSSTTTKHVHNLMRASLEQNYKCEIIYVEDLNKSIDWNIGYMRSKLFHVDPQSNAEVKVLMERLDNLKLLETIGEENGW